MRTLTLFDPCSHALLYQPQLELLGRRVIGYEALMRALSPDGHLMSPERTLARARAAGELAAVGAWTLDSAATQAAVLQAAGLDVPISINLSPGQLHAGLPDAIAERTRTLGLPRDALCVELTEDMPLDEAGERVLEALVELGVPIALDDLGRDFAGLDRLVALPWAQLKIDRRVVRQACDGHGRARAVVRAVAGLGRELGTTVIAEGLESERDVGVAMTLGVVVGQGYGLGVPVPGAVLEEAAREAEATLR